MDDNLAIQRIRLKDQNGLEYLMDLYGSLVIHLVRQILGPHRPGEIEECANDVWLVIWQKAIHFNPEKSCVKTWICMITRSKAIDRLRKIYSSAGSTVSLDSEKMTDIQVEMMELPDMLEDREEIRKRANLLMKALSKITFDERNLLIRRYFYFEDISELARSLGVSRAAMDNRLSRARKLLHQYYLEVYDDEIH